LIFRTKRKSQSYPNPGITFGFCRKLDAPRQYPVRNRSNFDCIFDNKRTSLSYGRCKSIADVTGPVKTFVAYPPSASLFSSYNSQLSDKTETTTTTIITTIIRRGAERCLKIAFVPFPSVSAGSKRGTSSAGFAVVKRVRARRYSGAPSVCRCNVTVRRARPFRVSFAGPRPTCTNSIYARRGRRKTEIRLVLFAGQT